MRSNQLSYLAEMSLSENFSSERRCKDKDSF